MSLCLCVYFNQIPSFVSEPGLSDEAEAAGNQFSYCTAVRDAVMALQYTALYITAL